MYVADDSDGGTEDTQFIKGDVLAELSMLILIHSSGSTESRRWW